MSRSDEEWRRLAPEYAASLAEVPPLEAAAERELATRARAGDRGARDRLVAANLRFVVRAVRPYRRPGVDLMDLVAEGNAALLTAAARFEPSRGHRFVSYAIWWIKDAVRRFLARHEGPLAVPMRRVREPGAGRSRAVLGGPGGPEPASADPIALVVEALDREAGHLGLARALGRLGARERDVVALYHGLAGVGPMDFRAIGRARGMSRETARCAYRRALARLRGVLPGR